MLRYKCSLLALPLASLVILSSVVTPGNSLENGQGLRRLLWDLEEGTGIDVSEHERIRREAAEETTTTSTTTTTAKPDKKKADKPKPFPDFPKLELDPDTESLSPNNTDPEIPLGFPPLMPPDGPLYPPGLYPGSPFGPSLPPRPAYPPGFEICFNPLALQPLPEDSKSAKMQKQIIKMQCDFVNMQTKLTKFQQNLEKELVELKKLNYNVVARIARLESMLRASPF
ncbi:WW domain-binding protein 11 [Nilaparvata lugens]|uniref:WW domain-binding protein 11 n=1 Tax=Nilaparvata lugens TaxID=108931 RepID=UPI00193D1716|nr:WW domain-binding protein 11 [Nilaparvata lugens]